MIAVCAILFAVFGLAAFALCAVAALVLDEAGPQAPAPDPRPQAETLDFGPWTLDHVDGGFYL